VVSDHIRSPGFRSWSRKELWPAAFALVHPARINEFHLYPCHVAGPHYPHLINAASSCLRQLLPPFWNEGKGKNRPASRLERSDPQLLGYFARVWYSPYRRTLSVWVCSKSLDEKLRPEATLPGLPKARPTRDLGGEGGRWVLPRTQAGQLARIIVRLWDSFQDSPETGQRDPPFPLSSRTALITSGLPALLSP